MQFSCRTFVSVSTPGVRDLQSGHESPITVYLAQDTGLDTILPGDGGSQRAEQGLDVWVLGLIPGAKCNSPPPPLLAPHFTQMK